MAAHTIVFAVGDMKRGQILNIICNQAREFSDVLDIGCERRKLKEIILSF